MPLTPEDVLHLAALARIDVTAAEATTLAAQLGAVLERVERIDAESPLPPDGLAPAADAMVAGARADVPGRDTLASGPDAIAPAWEDGFFTIPRLASHHDVADEPEEAP